MKTDVFFYTDRKGPHEIYYKDIVRFCAEGNYTLIFLTHGSAVVISMELCEAEEKLFHGHPFIRIHRKHLINFNYAVRVGKTRTPLVMMKFGLPVKARRSMIVPLQRMLNQRK